MDVPLNVQPGSSVAAMPGNQGNDVVRIMVSEAVEGMEDVSLNIDLAQPRTHSTLLTYWTAEGTAKGGEDFLMDRGVLRLKAGETKVALWTRLVDDQDPEDDEDFSMHVAAYPEIPGFDEQNINVTIRDND